MKRMLLACAIAIVANVALAHDMAPKPAAIDYEVRRLHEVDGDRFEITLRFRGDASGRCTVRIPADWAGAERPERGIDDWAVLTPGAHLEHTDRSQVLRITHRPRARVVLRYRLRQIPDGDLHVRWGTIGKLPYWRGMLLAARWDAAIRASSHGARSLDDAMRALRDDRRIGIERLDADRIVRAIRQEGVFEAGSDVARFIERGDLPVLDDATLTSCIRIDTIVDRGFEPEFDVEQSIRTRRITAVDGDGPAYAAGLRDGQKMVSVSLGQRTDIPATVGVEESDGSDRRVVEYLPWGREVVRQRIAMQERRDEAQLADCRAELVVDPC